MLLRLSRIATDLRSASELREESKDTLEALLTAQHPGPFPVGTLPGDDLATSISS